MVRSQLQGVRASIVTHPLPYCMLEAWDQMSLQMHVILYGPILCILSLRCYIPVTHKMAAVPLKSGLLET